MLFERSRILRKLRIHFEHHVVLVQLREYRRDLALAECVVERVVDRLRQYAQTRCRVAIDHQLGFEPAVLLVGGDVAQLTAAVCSLSTRLGRPSAKFLRVGVFHRILDIACG